MKTGAYTRGSSVASRCNPVINIHLFSSAITYYLQTDVYFRGDFSKAQRAVVRPTFNEVQFNVLFKMSPFGYTQYPHTFSCKLYQHSLPVLEDIMRRDNFFFFAKYVCFLFAQLVYSCQKLGKPN